MRPKLIFSVVLLFGSGCLDGGMDVDDGATGIGAAQAPLITALSPRLVSSAGGDVVMVQGQGFAPDVSAQVGEVPAQVAWRSPQQLQITVPPQLGRHGTVDLAVANPRSPAAARGVLTYYPGSLQFGGNMDYPSGMTPVGLRLADLGGGQLDLVGAFATRGVQAPGSAVTVLTGQGDGRFAFKKDYLTGDGGLASMAVGDVTGDGLADVVVANDLEGTLGLYPGMGNGGFAARVDLAAGDCPVAVLIADVDGDGRNDLVVANDRGHALTILYGRASGGFLTRTVALDHSPFALAAGDFNGDGHVDLALSDILGGEVDILLGQGDGSFMDSGARYPTGANPISLAAGDLNNDGSVDLVSVNRVSNDLTVLLGKGDGTFTTLGNPYVGSMPLSLALADLNNDGKLDVVLPCAQSKQVAVLLGRGDGLFQPVTYYPVGDDNNGVAVGDVNGDGLADILAANNNGTFSVLLNTSL